MKCFKRVCCWPLKVLTRAFAGPHRSNVSTSSPPTSDPTTRSCLERRLRFNKKWPCPHTACMLRTISSAAPGFEAAVRLLQGGRRPSTVKSYDHKWLKFEAFTSHAQDDAGAPRLCSLPASSQTVVTYLGYLLEAGTINAKSLARLRHASTAAGHGISCRTHVCDCAVRASSRRLQPPGSRCACLTA